MKFIGKKVLLAVVSLFVIAAFIILITSLNASNLVLQIIGWEKPVIYLYPEVETDVLLQLHFQGQLTFTYPLYDGMWAVTAFPDGRLVDQRDGHEYRYLFWEGEHDADFDLSSGFVVAGEDIVDFFRDKLAFLGLEPHEYNDFIVYWGPKMQGNALNLITFQGDVYTDAARLEISPAPDSLIRVFIVWKVLNEPIDLPVQVLEPHDRFGFTVVEWGGAEIR